MRITLNLLPPDNKKALRAGLFIAYAQSMIFVFLLMCAFASGTLFAVRMLMLGTYQDLARRSTSGSAEYKSMSDEIRKINLYLQHLDERRKTFTPWSKVLAAIGDMVPEGTRLDRIQLTANGAISVAGVSETREEVLLLQSRLDKSGMFKNVQSPLSNILQQRNVRFDFEMVYLKPQPAK